MVNHLHFIDDFTYSLSPDRFHNEIIEEIHQTQNYSRLPVFPGSSTILAVFVDELPVFPGSSTIMPVFVDELIAKGRNQEMIARVVSPLRSPAT